ncbi:MBL fold metallo-hydrolase [Paenibacillus sp. FSL R5-0810]|uniref:MBL fold metallo-hydrolase n=1 Tax=Paenibacillus sp. FSL R5-0810 TaxID=2921659 RepID=UPI0030FA89A3
MFTKRLASDAVDVQQRNPSADPVAVRQLRFFPYVGVVGAGEAVFAQIEARRPERETADNRSCARQRTGASDPSNLQNASASADASAKPRSEYAIVHRTGDVFDTKSYQDQLTVRYFFLDREEKPGDSIFLQNAQRAQHHDPRRHSRDKLPIGGVYERLGVTRIDYAINTHPHYDHMGGYTSLLRAKEIGGFYIPNIEHTTGTYRTVMDLFEQHDISRCMC